MSQHTPGPWKWISGPHLDALLVPHTYTFGDGYILSPDQWGMDDGTNDVNARLIAKAPEMLGCLAGLLNELDANRNRGACLGIVLGWAPGARALLREVEGE